MKKILFSSLFVLLSSLSVFAVDSDADGLPNEIDKCPEVRGVRGLDGCPRVDVFASEIQIGERNNQNLCYQEILPFSSFFVAYPVCLGEQSCATLRHGAGLQRCDILFPVILSRDGDPMARGDIFILR